MDLSHAFQNEAKKYNVSEQYLIFADLLSIGYSQSDAYNIAFHENAGLSLSRNKGLRDDILNSTSFKKLLEKRKELRKRVIPAGPDTELMDKRATATEIMQTALALPHNSKERIEGLMKYSDLMGYKREEVTDEMDNINFFFPLKCHQCPLFFAYNQYLKEIGEKVLQPVDMMPMIEKAKVIINQLE